MVIVPDIGDFDVVSLQFLRDFLTAIDAVLEVTAALDFPAVVDAAASGQACNDEWGENFKRTRVHFIKIKMIVQNVILSECEEPS